MELNWNQRLGHKKTKLNICHHMLASSTQLSFHVLERRRTSSKCQKMKNTRAKIPFFIVKYANLWGFCCRRHRGRLSSLLSSTIVKILFFFFLYNLLLCNLWKKQNYNWVLTIIKTSPIFKFMTMALLLSEFVALGLLFFAILTRNYWTAEKNDILVAPITVLWSSKARQAVKDEENWQFQFSSFWCSYLV